MAFSDLGLSDGVLRAIADAGYIEPTPIQAQAIPVVLTGRDVLGCAQTGTGKTAGFTLPMIDILAAGRAKARMPRSLILTPTRELATQIAENFEIYGKYHKLTKALLIGGVSMDEQTRNLDRGVDVLIATPGRLLDHFERGRILLTDMKILVIDEADRMLDMGFIPDVERIAGLLPPLRQTLFFSATMPPEIRRLADKFLRNPKEITVAPPARPVEKVEQFLAVVDAADKREVLRRILSARAVTSALIFCNRKRDVEILKNSMRKHGYNAAAIHGDLSQGTRTETLEAFKAGGIDFLVASDVAARGLDIDDMPCVINFDVPYHPEDYVHRIGRTARAGRSGRAFTIAEAGDGRHVAAIESLIGKDIPRFEVAGVDAVALEDGPRGRRRGGARKPAKAAPPSRRKGGGEERAAAEARKPGPEARAERPREKTRERAGERPPETRAERPRKERRERAEERPHAQERPRAEERERGAERPVVGMGGHIPAFMLRPARPHQDKTGTDG